MKPLQRIDKKIVESALQAYQGRKTFIHAEVIPGGFLRNISVQVIQSYIAGDGPYRVALRTEDEGWIRMESLTDYEIDDQGRLLIAGHDDQGRITTAFELSLSPFLFKEV
jgi:Protein of unknown function (DUF1806)